MRVLICGAGVIGASIAYFLSRRGVEVTVIERVEVASAASGKSGGFLALDWCDGTPLERLARRSFELHAALPAEIGDDWGYRRVDTFGGLSGKGPGVRSYGHALNLDWVSSDVAINQRLGSPDTTAQVDPARFTHSVMRAAERHGAKLRLGEVSALLRDESGQRVAGVRVGAEVLEGDAVVIAMGPWSAVASRWVPLPAVFGLKGHSIIFETGPDVPAEALFLEHEDPSGASSSPEVFPRSNGTTYVCAISTETPLPSDPAEVKPDPGAIERLAAICSDLSPVLRRSPIVAKQACYRPVTRDGLPFIGGLPGLAGAFVATGHSVWGILNAPATGEAMSQLILDGAAATVEISPFDPARMRPLRRHN